VHGHKRLSVTFGLAPYCHDSRALQGWLPAFAAVEYAGEDTSVACIDADQSKSDQGFLSVHEYSEHYYSPPASDGMVDDTTPVVNNTILL
jgi:hypothetical protein